MASAETTINYTALMMLRSKSITEAIPKVLACIMYVSYFAVILLLRAQVVMA